MGITAINGLQSEIYVPVAKPPVWTEVTKELNDMTVALVTAAGVHLKSDKRFNLAGDTSYRVVPNADGVDQMMVTHGGYDNADVNKDINCMFPIDRLNELAGEGMIKAAAVNHYTFMGGGGNQDVFINQTGPEIARKLKEEGVDAAILTAGWGTCHRTAACVQRAIEEIGIPTIIISALPPVTRQNGSPRAVAPIVPMGANAGAPNDSDMQREILRATLKQLVEIKNVGETVPLPFEYHAII